MALPREPCHFNVGVGVGGYTVVSSEGIRTGKTAIDEEQAVEDQRDGFERAERAAGTRATPANAASPKLVTCGGRTSVLSPNMLLPRMPRFDPGKITCQYP